MGVKLFYIQYHSHVTTVSVLLARVYYLFEVSLSFGCTVRPCESRLIYDRWRAKRGVCAGKGPAHRVI